MSLAILAIAVAATAGPFMPFQSVNLGGENSHRRLATLHPYPANRADDVRRPGFNGKLWIGEFNIGPYNTYYPMGYGDPGTAAYGAVGQEFERAYARIGHLAVGISPWVAFNGDGLHEFEAARGEWLQERGYTGGVRTHVNDLYLADWMNDGTMARPMTRDIKPRGTIELPDDMPRFKSREQVMRESGTVSRKSAGRISLPPIAGSALAQRVSQSNIIFASK